MILGLLLDKTKTKVEISKLVGVSEKRVRTTARNFQLCKLVGDLPRPGRPPKLSDRDTSQLVKEVRKDPKLSCTRLAAEFSAKFPKVRISRETVRKRL